MVFELWIVKISCFEGVLCEIGKMGYEIRYIDRYNKKCACFGRLYLSNHKRYRLDLGSNQ